MTPKQRRLTEKQIKSAKDAADAITGIGDWGTTPDGRFFWAYVVESLVNQATNGTNDGKPWIDLELTDEDALRRPWVKIRSDSRDEWGSFLVRLIYVRPKGVEYRFVVEDPKELHDVTAWGCCRRATPEEIEAANAERQ
jgi:hypothetical protein